MEDSHNPVELNNHLFQSCLYSTFEEAITFNTKGFPRRIITVSKTCMLQVLEFHVTVCVGYTCSMPMSAQTRTISTCFSSVATSIKEK